MTITNKRCIFCLTTGRSGTKYLSQVFDLLPNVKAFHEPVPDFISCARSARENPQDGIRFVIDKKIPAINAIKEPIYIETSHLFCKGFVEIFADLDIDFDIIILKRKQRTVAKSLYGRKSIPGQKPNGVKYLLTPNADGVFTKLNDWKNLHHYQLCYWYCLEIERRIEIYKNFKSVKRIAETTLKDITTVDGLYQLCENLDLPWFTTKQFEQYLKIKDKKSNQNSSNAIAETSKFTDKQLEQWESEVKCKTIR